jgi:hypothetical protein
VSEAAFVGIRRIRPGYPSLSARSQGWLRYLYRKATTPDSWDRDGHPHDHWDALSEAPMLSWHRFDLIDSCYAVALMADQTPAWREAYGVILDQLVTRYTGWWSAADWLTQFGHDPARAQYPDYYRLLMPEDLWGEYDAPGWTANGVEPWGLQIDPIGADGNLFFKGWFLVVLGLYRRTTGDAKWSEPFDMVRDGDLSFSWSHPAIAQHLVRQWSNRPEGCHCENTKIWPLCLTAAGLGLKLFDLLQGTDDHEVFRRWWRDKARHDYLAFDGDTPGAMTTFYYDPIIDRHHLLPAFASSSFVAYYLAAQVPDDARALWDSAREQLGLLHPPYTPALDPRGTAVYLFLANEWGESELASAIREDAETRYEPTWDERTGEFTWGFALGEPHPRGQWNAAMAAAEANTGGGWWRLANVFDDRRFTEPTLVGVDFPTVVPTQAWWDALSDELVVSLAPCRESTVGTPTSFRVANLPDPGLWTATSLTNDVHVESSLSGNYLEVTTTVAHVSLLVHRS